MEKTGKQIAKRVNPNDIFITPDTLVQEHYDLVEPYLRRADIILDPCSHETGKYLKKFKEEGYETDWCEITMGRDFFDYAFHTVARRGALRCAKAIIGNPPYSLIDPFLHKIIEIKPRVVSLLIGFANITTKRLELMEKAGYVAVEFHLTKVFKWYGMSLLIVWVAKDDMEYLGLNNVVGWDRKVHR